MTRKDYIAIAEALRFARGRAKAAPPIEVLTADELELNGVMAAAEYIADAMQDDNPRFDRERFLAVVRGERDLNSRPPKHKGREEESPHVTPVPHCIDCRADKDSVLIGGEPCTPESK